MTMPRCKCSLTPCRTKVQAPDTVCRFCSTWCLRELARRRKRRRFLWLLAVATVATVIGLSLQFYFLGG
jgi:predicted nucleic acid-binding Zn ribbon protein